MLARRSTLALLAAAALAACGGSEDPTNLLPPTGTCRIGGALDASVPVGATATLDEASGQWMVSLNGDAGAVSFVSDVWIGAAPRAGTYTLATAGEMTFLSVFEAPSDLAATRVWMAGSLSPEVAPAGALELTVTAVGDATHGSLVATLLPESLTGAAGQVTVACAF